MTRLHVPKLSEAQYERAARKYCRSLPLEHFMEATPQSNQREITLESLAVLRIHQSDVQVFNELLVQYPLPGNEIGQVVPDNMVVLSDAPPRAKGSFNLPYESAKPLWVLEYVSAYNPRKDYKKSFQKYEQELKVPYCLMFRPDTNELHFFKHNGKRYRRPKPNARGRYAIPELELEVGMHEGWVRFWYQGQLLPLPADFQRQLDAARRQLEQEKQRAEQEKQRAEQEKQRAEQEKQRAEQERALRQAAEAELARLRAEIEQSQQKK